MSQAASPGRPVLGTAASCYAVHSMSVATSSFETRSLLLTFSPAEPMESYHKAGVSRGMHQNTQMPDFCCTQEAAALRSRRSGREIDTADSKSRRIASVQ